MVKWLSWGWVAAFMLLAPQGAAGAKPLWQFRVMQGEKISGRLDFGVVHREGIIYAVSAFYAGEQALDTGKHKKIKPDRRSYAELEEPGLLGKYKRWDVRKKVERYWMTFIYKGKVKVRYEKGPGAKGEVTEVGEAKTVVPLDAGQPQLAYLLAAAGESGREVACVGASPMVWGKTTVVFSGPEEIVLPGAGEEKTKAARWDVMGDCGQFKVYLDESGKPLLITSESEKYIRLIEGGKKIQGGRKIQDGMKEVKPTTGG
ncbi:MAG: hypothetical protein GXP54_00915 [Deltaproteobacteria bacterium]|nr:hypothetical protein [Deltaproteobacteria bacterium]